MLNLKTNKVLITRDVRWLNTMDPGDNQFEIYHEIDKDDDDDYNKKEEKPQPQTIESNKNERNVVVNRARITPELRRLQTFNNPGRLEIEGENANLCFFVPKIVENDDTPTTFQEAWNHEDPTKRENGGKQFDWSSSKGLKMVFGEMKE